MTRNLPTRLVAFVDLLGVSAALSRPDSRYRYARNLESILRNFLRKDGEPWIYLPHVFDGDEIEIEQPGPITKGSKVTTLSDSIVISVPFGPRLPSQTRLRRIFDCLFGIYGLQRALLALGLRSRGGVSTGGLIHKTSLIVGDGLVSAYQLENQLAIFPRVIVDPVIIDELVDGDFPKMWLFRNRIANLLRRDSDGYYFIDYLNSDPVTSPTNIWREFERILSAAEKDLAETSNLSVHQKINWLLNYASLTLNQYDNNENPRFDHGTGDFVHRYYRDNVTMASVYRKLENGEISQDDFKAIMRKND